MGQDLREMGVGELNLTLKRQCETADYFALRRAYSDNVKLAKV